ncbi:putative leader peptide [Streptomyces humicola]
MPTRPDHLPLATLTDMKKRLGLTRRRHVDLVRVSSAVCRCRRVA